jgi:hypothetical protein
LWTSPIDAGGASGWPAAAAAAAALRAYLVAMGEEEATQQFWREFMKTDEAQDALKAQYVRFFYFDDKFWRRYKEEYEQLADKYEKKVKPDELRELGEALLDVSRELKHVVAPVLKYEFAQRLLYGFVSYISRFI